MKGKLCALLLALLCLTGCSGAGSKTPDPPPVRNLAEEEAAALADFSLRLLRSGWTDGNVLVSPLSVLSALGMTANGAKGETLAQMEAVLGLPAADLNNALAVWRMELPQDKGCRVDLANSLWVRDDGNFEADPSFLQTASDWYGAEVFPSKLDASAVREVNAWVKKNTHGMIDGMVDRFSSASMLCLVNALALEAEWQEPYRADQVWDGRVFTTEDGREQPVELMYSIESHYLKDEDAQGFLKFYQGGRWAFAALLPEEGVPLEDYAASLTGERLYGILKNWEQTAVEAAVPKFECAYAAELNEPLKDMGMTDAFDLGLADFSGLGSSPLGPLFISQVLHKAYIRVNEKGTRAGAAAAVSAVSGGTMPGPAPVVYLDRPFLYMLVDMETNLPAFLGAVTSLE